MKRIISLVVGVLIFTLSGIAYGDSKDHRRKGLNRKAKQELVAAGVNKYAGMFSPADPVGVGEGWMKHTFDSQFGAGPICITGSEYSVFTKKQNPKKLLIMLQGGGACWQDFYRCNLFSEAQEPPPPPVGIWADSFPPGTGMLPNPIGDWSIVYMPYCDGSVFSGDNTVPDPFFQAFIEAIFDLDAGTGPPFRLHRGLRNVTAGIDLAKSTFPKARQIFLAGSSAGGVGAAGFAPFLVRMAYGNRRQLMVFNDAGPVAINPIDVGNILARAADWRFGQFYPASCTECDDIGQGTAIIKWRLDNDRSIRESFYSTDGDETNRFFLNVPTQVLYRDLIVTEHGLLNEAHPKRYKRFIRSGDDSHTALQTPLYYFGEANGVPLNEWVGAFVANRQDYDDDSDSDNDSDSDSDSNKQTRWIDIVEDFIPLP